MNEKEVLSSKEAGKFLTVDVQTVLKLVKTGELPGRRVGRHFKFLKKDLEKYLSGKNKE